MASVEAEDNRGMSQGVRKGSKESSCRLKDRRNEIKRIKQPTLASKQQMLKEAWHFI